MPCTPAASRAVIVLIVCAAAARAEVILDSSGGQRIIGEAIEKQDDATIVVRIYGGFTRAVPKGAVAKLDDRGKEYGEFAAPSAPRPGMEAPAPMTAGRRAEVDLSIAAYFAPGADRAKALEAIKDLMIPWSDVPEIARAIFTAARAGTKVAAGDHEFTHGDIKGDVHIEVFPDDAKGRLPVFLLLHGGGENDGDWHSGGPAMIKIIKKTWKQGIFVCPTVLQKKYAEWGKNPQEEIFCRELLKAVKRTWEVDTDQVYLGGYSMGGYGTWHIGAHEADQFAGLVSGAGGILIGQERGETWGWGILGNLRHVPIVFLHGTADAMAPVWSDQKAHDILAAKAKGDAQVYRHQYLEYAGADHSAPFSHLEEAIPWALEAKRNARPRTVTWEPSRDFVRHLYWLHVDRPRFFTSIDAAHDGNHFDLTVQRLAGGFSVLVDREMVDVAKPVTVTVNGAPAFAGLVQPQLPVMIESIDDQIDEAMWFPAAIRFDAPAGAAAP